MDVVLQAVHVFNLLSLALFSQEDEKSKKKHKHKKKEKDKAAAGDEKEKKKKSRSKKTEVDELEDFLGGGAGSTNRDDGDYEEL